MAARSAASVVVASAAAVVAAAGSVADGEADRCTAISRLSPTRQCIDRTFTRRAAELLVFASLASSASAQQPSAEQPSAQQPSAQQPSERPPARPLGQALATSDPMGAISAVRQLPGGRVLVNDPARRRVVMLDSNMKLIKVVADTTPMTQNAYGARGGGLLPWHGDSTLFLDPASLSMLVLDQNGEIRRVMAAPRPDDVFSLVGGALGFPGFDAKGRLVYRATGLNFNRRGSVVAGAGAARADSSRRPSRTALRSSASTSRRASSTRSRRSRSPRRASTSSRTKGVGRSRSPSIRCPRWTTGQCCPTEPSPSCARTTTSITSTPTGRRPPRRAFHMTGSDSPTRRRAR